MPRIVAIVLFFSYTIVYSQTVAIDTNLSVAELIESHLFDGCIEVSNISSAVNGSVNSLSSFGAFSKSTSNFPFDNGIILSTGDANSAGNTVNTADLNEGDANWGTDSDLLDELGITNTINATSIEFDFISALDKVRFEYILASEEYLQSAYICNNQDVFALLIREASITGPYTNIARVGSQNDLIGPGTIHPDIFGFCTQENEPFFDNYSIGDTNFDGRTTPITSVANVIPNTLYHAKLIIADGSDQNFDSAVFIKTTVMLPELKLGKDVSTCGSSVNLNADIGIIPATYDWYFNNVLISPNGGPTFIATQTGSYKVKVTIPLNLTDCVNEDTINVTLSSVQTINPVSDYALCDPNGDGLEFFDLSTKNSDVLAAAPPGTYDDITYHSTLALAEANISPITTSIQNTSNPQVVYVRLENTTGCLAYAPINLVVNPIPPIPNLNPFIVCDDDAIRDQTTALNLTSFSSSITDGDPNLDVSYHATMAKATSGENPLPSKFSSSSVQLFVRIFNINTNCFNVLPIDIEVYNTPELTTEPLFLDACDPDHDGFASFNLETALPDIIADLTGLTPSFYTSLTTAQSGMDPIPVPTDYTNITIREQVIYVRIEDDNSGCFSVRSFEIHANLLLSQTDLIDIPFCDEDGDGMHTFDLDPVSDIIKNMLLGLTITYYETLADQNNNNPITTPTYTFTGPSITLFIDIESSSCLEQTEIVFVLIDVVRFDNIPDQRICDTDADGFTPLNLNNFNAAVTGNQSGFQVLYFETPSDAENNVGALPNNYVNTSNPQTLYVSVTESATSCADTSSFEVTVVPAAAINLPIPIVICDDDDDGVFIINLENLIPSLTSTPNNVDFSFFTSLNNANLEIDPITATTAFDAQTQTLYIRAEENLTTLRCPVIIPLNIIVNTLPIIPTIENYDVCVNSSTNPIFLMNTKDLEILNGQNGKEVFYYEDSSFTQLIDKNQPYIGNNFPQTIFVKVDNITDSNCFSTASFSINIIPFPVYNDTINVDVIGCDNNDIDGKIDIDLNTIVTTLTQGISPAPMISFFTTLSNAENNTAALPLNYENTSNPQTVFIRIEHNSNGCYLTDSFGINVLSTPNVRQVNNLTQCDTDYDGLTTFNLEDYEIGIFDVRQNFLVATYFDSLQNLENGFPEIPDVTAFQTTSNPQTIYIKVLNTATNCFTTAPLTLTAILPPDIDPITEYPICDTDTKTFDLTEINDKLTTASDISFDYFDSLTDAEAEIEENSITIFNYQSSSTPIFVRVKNDLTNCFYIHNFNFIVNPLPIANQPPNLEDCDDDFDGELEFDISGQTPLIIGNQDPSNFDVHYYKDRADAEQDNENDRLDELHNVTNFETIVAQIINKTTKCVNYTSFTITVNPLPIVEQTNTIPQCDTDYDGLTIFNLKNHEINIYDILQNSLVPSYFKTLEALENGIPDIPDPTSFQTTSNPQTIYIKVLNTATNCFTTAPITLAATLPPVINLIPEYPICDTDTKTFDLREINDSLTTEIPNVLFHYFDSLTDAEAGREEDSITIFNYQLISTPLFVRIQNTVTNCFYIHNFNFIVNPLPIANQPPNLEDCDDDFDGELEFDISGQTPLIIGNQDPSNFDVHYYKDRADAEQDNENDRLDELHNVTNFETIVARIINKTTKCVNYTSFTITVNPLPIVNIPQQVICLDDLPLVVTADTLNDEDTYLWSTGQTTPEIIIETIGDYSVTVTTPKRCVNSSNFEVIISEAASIEFTEVLNFTDPNSITITIEDGIGDYRYQLDNGPLQVSNFFNYVTLGYHTITVVDLNGCSKVTKEVLVINAQKFFTPNNDTYFDTWNIIGIETLPGSVIYIFDRYGKLLVNLNHDSGGWDGTYRGYEMPSNDYWFLAKIKTPSEEFEYKGHFALKR